jgi:hypothetical protein
MGRRVVAVGFGFRTVEEVNNIAIHYSFTYSMVRLILDFHIKIVELEYLLWVFEVVDDKLHFDTPIQAISNQ